MVATNDMIPSGVFQTKTYGSIEDVHTYDMFPEKRVILFGVVGAYNDTCRDQYMSYVEHYDQLKANKGIDEIYCVAVNDVNVLSEWWKSLGSHENIKILSDGSGNYARALGVAQDLSSRNLGQRQRRFSMLVDNNVIKAIHSEDIDYLSETLPAKLLEEVI